MSSESPSSHLAVSLRQRFFCAYQDASLRQWHTLLRLIIDEKSDVSEKSLADWITVAEDKHNARPRTGWAELLDPLAHALWSFLPSDETTWKLPTVCKTWRRRIYDGCGVTNLSKLQGLMRWRFTPERWRWVKTLEFDGGSSDSVESLVVVNLRQLESVTLSNLRGCAVTIAGLLRILDDCTSLTRLEIALGPEDLELEELKNLVKKLPRLRYLSLGEEDQIAGNYWRWEWIQPILPQISELRLNGFSFPTEEIVYPLPRLQKLVLGVSIEDEGEHVNDIAFDLFHDLSGSLQSLAFVVDGDCRVFNHFSRCCEESMMWLKLTCLDIASANLNPIPSTPTFLRLLIRSCPLLDTLKIVPPLSMEEAQPKDGIFGRVYLDLTVLSHFPKLGNLFLYPISASNLSYGLWNQPIVGSSTFPALRLLEIPSFTFFHSAWAASAKQFEVRPYHQFSSPCHHPQSVANWVLEESEVDDDGW